MNNRVYGAVGIGAVMANLNADFNGLPKQTLDGRFFASDKSLKYSMRRLWKDSGEKVLYFKRYDFKKIKGKKKGTEKEANKENKIDAIAPISLKEAYEGVFNASLDAGKTEMKEVITNLFQAVDVQNFGAAFAVEGFNTSITGAVQIGQGFNLDEDSVVEIQDILSPFPSSEEKGQSSVGKQILLNEGHYIFPFSINPTNYNVYTELLGIENPYSETTYKKFQKAALQGVTYLNSCAKAGAFNEFGLFVELKEESELYLEPIVSLITFTKENGKAIYDFTKVSERLNNLEEEIEKTVLYYNPYKVEVKGTDGFELKNLFTDLI